MDISDLKLERSVKIRGGTDALIIVDVQNDFVPGGALPVEGGDTIIEDINKVIKLFWKKGGYIVLTQDWHPENHESFASNHRGKEPMDEYQSGGIGPVLWPDHCVQGTEGAEFPKNLNTNLASAIIRKGLDPEVDSYSGFLENDKKSATGLEGYLKSLKVEWLFICGLALDYCCYYTAMDAKDLGFNAYIISDITKGIDIPSGNISKCLDAMTKKGIRFTNSNSFI